MTMGAMRKKIIPPLRDMPTLAAMKMTTALVTVLIMIFLPAQMVTLLSAVAVAYLAMVFAVAAARAWIKLAVNAVRTACPAAVPSA